MKTIKESFNRQGYECELIERNGICAIYECKDVSSMSIHFEVVRVKKHQAVYQIKDYTANIGDEYLPSTNDWRKYGWTMMTLTQARMKMNEVTESVTARLN